MSRSRALVLFALALASALGAVAACGSDDPSTTAACAPADVRSCSCANGDQGRSTCSVSGDAYGLCVCESDAGTDADASTFQDGGPDATISDADVQDAIGDDASDAPDGALLPFLAACSSDAQCESMLCHAFPSKGPHCTKACTMDAECPAPSPGCNPMGICRAP